jgi:flagellar hook-basal body complex protein FliE
MNEMDVTEKIEPNKISFIKNQIENQLSLSERDLYLRDIDEQIIARRNFILEKTKAIEKKKKVNHFLEDVANDYKKYYEYIVNEKQQQYNFMLQLQQYLDDLTKTQQMADHELKNAKRDQRELLHEMDKIKAELEKYVS